MRKVLDERASLRARLASAERVVEAASVFMDEADWKYKYEDPGQFTKKQFKQAFEILRAALSSHASAQKPSCGDKTDCHPSDCHICRQKKAQEPNPAKIIKAFKDAGSGGQPACGRHGLSDCRRCQAAADNASAQEPKP